MKKFLLLLCLSGALFSQESPFKERLKVAQNGDYIVTEANRMISILVVRNRNSSSIVIEEISAPIQNLKNRPASWAEWVKNKAPGHTSWSMTEIDLSNDQLLECYSFSRSAWLQLSQQENVLTTLLHLPLRPVASEKRRKIGPPPLAGDTDHRQVWNPPLTVEGKKIEKAEFSVFETDWPKDSSDLSGKTVCLYFDQEQKFSFPCWIQVEAAHATATLRVIDGGKNLPTLYPALPRRVPQFIGLPQWIDPNTLRLSIKSPKYYKQFDLFAIDVTTREKKMHPLSCSIQQGPGETINLDIEKGELAETLKEGHRYTWLLVPAGFSEFYTESTKPFYWTEP